MRTLRMFFGVVVAVALIGVSAAFAEIKFSVEEIPFPVSTDDGSISLPDVVFCKLGPTGGGEEAQDGCLMSPTGAAPNTMLDLPMLAPLAAPARAEGYTSAQAAIAPISSLQSPTPYRERALRGLGGTSTGTGTTPSTPPAEDEPPPQIVVIPEPATLVIVGLGIGGAVVAQRRRQQV